MAILASDPGHPGLGYIRSYGECRNPTDHRENNTLASENITAELGS